MSAAHVFRFSVLYASIERLNRKFVEAIHTKFSYRRVLGFWVDCLVEWSTKPHYVMDKKKWEACKRTNFLFPYMQILTIPFFKLELWKRQRPYSLHTLKYKRRYFDDNKHILSCKQSGVRGRGSLRAIIVTWFYFSGVKVLMSADAKWAFLFSGDLIIVCAHFGRTKPLAVAEVRCSPRACLLCCRCLDTRYLSARLNVCNVHNEMNSSAQIARTHAKRVHLLGTIK